jgi:hypothetical protein
LTVVVPFWVTCPLWSACCTSDGLLSRPTVTGPGVFAPPGSETSVCVWL